MDLISIGLFIIAWFSRSNGCFIAAISVASLCFLFFSTYNNSEEKKYFVARIISAAVILASVAGMVNLI